MSIEKTPSGEWRVRYRQGGKQRSSFGSTRGDGMREEPTIAYHGTKNREAVLREGLRIDKSDCGCCVWLARDPLVAATFGDVVEVDLTDIPGEWPEGEWQAQCAVDIGPELLRARPST